MIVNTVTIPNGANVSANVIGPIAGRYSSVSILIIPPSVLPETVTILVTGINNEATLTSANADIVVYAGKAIPITFMGASSFKLKSATNVGALRTFEICVSVN